MIFDIKFNVSVRCSECGEKISAAMSMNSENGYDSILEVEPHTCRTHEPQQCTCVLIGPNLMRQSPDCPVHGSKKEADKV